MCTLSPHCLPGVINTRLLHQALTCVACWAKAKKNSPNWALFCTYTEESLFIPTKESFIMTICRNA